MSIFQLQPKIQLSLDDIDTIRVIDITLSQRIKEFLKTFRGIAYQPYVVKDGERPDYVAYKIYKDPTLDWMILLANDMYSVYEDWPKDQNSFENYITDKYESLNSARSTVKYYYDSKRNIIDLTTYTALSPLLRSSESIYDWEFRKNINKSKIKVILPSLVGPIQTELKSRKIIPIT